MSELISGKEAKLAWANGEELQEKYHDVEKWSTLTASSKFCISNFENPLFKFRIKPQKIKINGVEWRTKDEIKQVAEELRSIFNAN